MHKKLIEIMEKKPSKFGLHGTANVYTTSDYYAKQIDEMKQTGASWFKLVVAGDSGVNTAKLLINAGLIPVIRYWHGTNAYPQKWAPPDLVKKYIDVGCVFHEDFNEFYLSHENIWGAAPGYMNGGMQNGEILHNDLRLVTPEDMTDYRTPVMTLNSMPQDWPTQMARSWGMFADGVLRSGGVPLTPAIESWRYYDVFEPLFAILSTGYRDLLEQSVISMHNRPLNHSINYVKDPGGYLGWTWMTKFIEGKLGRSLPMMGTESGPEVGWDQDSNFPKITPEIHCQMWKDIFAVSKPDHYLADCGWLWRDEGSFQRASWKLSPDNGGKDLPIVSWLKTHSHPVELTDNTIRVIGKNHPSQVSLNPGAALYKAAQAAFLGWAETSEWAELGHIWQKFQHGVVVCKDGDWGNVRVVRW